MSRETSVLDRPAPPPDLTLRYGPLPEHVVDLRFPPAVPGRAAPLIVLIHGGFWRPAYDRTHLGHFDLIDPQSRAWPRVMSALADALSGWPADRQA